MKRSLLGAVLVLATGWGTCRAETPAPTPPDPLTRCACDCSAACPAPTCSPAACCDPCGKAGPADPRVWGSADYLLWWVRKAEVPPLVVTGSPFDLFPGALDQPGTRILFGNDGPRYGAFNGLRLDLGAWLDDEESLGVEAGGFVMERRSVQFNARGDANGQPFLAAPFVNALTGNQNVYFISQNLPPPALSALLTGGVGIFSATQLWGWDVNGVVNVLRDDAWRVDGLVGFRQLSLRESLSYVETASNLDVGGAVEFLGTSVPPGFTVTTYDKFKTDNRFNGGQVGARVERRLGPLTVDVLGKLGLGSMHERVIIEGSTTTNAPFPVTQAPGGIYAQTTNIGGHSHDAFAVVPEFGLNLAVDVTANVRARLGYTFLYASSVVRPGDQINPRINPGLVPIDATFGTPGGPAQPAFERKATGFWAQGINFGIEFAF